MYACSENAHTHGHILRPRLPQLHSVPTRTLVNLAVHVTYTQRFIQPHDQCSACLQEASLRCHQCAYTMLTCAHVHMYMSRFPLEILPLGLFYTASVFCAQALTPYCLTREPPLCVTDTRTWPMWVWWAASSLRSLPRMWRLKRYWRGLETNLDVRLGASSSLHKWQYTKNSGKSD